MSKASDHFEIPRKSYVLEFWVGVFTIIGMLSFGYLSINIAGMSFGSSDSYKVTARFTNIAGLKKGASVEIAGVKVGDVENINLDGVRALVGLKIHNGVKLREDDIAQIRTKGIIGDRYVKISPGGAEESLANGSSITDTESAVEFEEIVGKFVHGMSNEKKE